LIVVDVGGTQQQQQLLLVATCHIHWDPDYSDVKLIQTMMLMNELKNIVEEVTSLGDGGTSSDSDDCHPCCPDVPLILCGDFNSLPNSGSLSTVDFALTYIDFDDILQKYSKYSRIQFELASRSI